MVIIEVVSPDVVLREFRSKDGRDFKFREQRAYLHLPGERYPLPFSVSLGERAAYSPGRYCLGVSSYRIGRYGSLELGRDLALQPLPADSASASAAARGPAPARAAGV